MDFYLKDYPKNIQNLQKSNDKDSDAFYSEMKILFYGLKLFGRSFYNRMPSGEFKIKFLSTQAFLWLINYSIQTYFALNILFSLSDKIKNANGFIPLVSFSINLVILSLHFYTPFSVIFETKKMCDYMNQWLKFQICFSTTIGHDFTPKYSRWIKISAYSMPFAVFFIVLYEADILCVETWFNTLLYMFMFINCNLNWFFWIGTLLEAGEASFYIIKNIQNIQKTGESTSEKIYALRKLWLMLSCLVRDLGTSMTTTMIVMVVVEHICFITAVYGFVTSILEKLEEPLIFLFIIGVTGFPMCVLIESADIATNKVGKNVKAALSQLRRKLDKSSNIEVEMFNITISRHYPTVSLGGFVDVNRSTVTSMIGTTVTYLIVLVQFYISSPRNV